MIDQKTPAFEARLSTLLFNSWTAEQSLLNATPELASGPIAIPQAYFAALFSARALLTTVYPEYQPQFRSEDQICRVMDMLSDKGLYMIPGHNVYADLHSYRPQVDANKLVDTDGLTKAIKLVDRAAANHEVRIVKQIGTEMYLRILKTRPARFDFVTLRFSLINANLRYV